MIDKKQILADLNKYFDYNGKVTVDDNTGKVSVTGSVYLKSNIKHTKLPVQFAVGSGSFGCSNNRLETLTGAPRSVSGNFYCEKNSNSLQTLAGLPKSIGGEFWCDYNPKLGLLRIILGNCTDINLVNAPVAVTQIIQKYLGKGQSGALQCAAELIRAGYRENAKL